MLALFAALALDPLFSAPTLNQAHTGALVIDAATGSTLYSRNPNDAFIPASTMKLIVGSAVLDILGDNFNFTTTLATDGRDLYLIGGGDILLDQKDVDEAAAAMRAAGLTYQKFYGDPWRYEWRTPYPDGWQVDDLPYDYAAPVSALSFNHNALTIKVLPGATPGTTPTLDVTPAVMSQTIINRSNTSAPGSNDTTDVTLYPPRAGFIEVSGLIPVDAKSASELDAAALDPVGLTLSVFGQTFGIQGQIGNAGSATGLRTLWQHHSEPLPKLVGDMWRPSDNLLAETLLEELGVASPGASDTRARGITRETNWLHGIGIDPKTLTIADGSGMSSYDRVTPRALVTILTHDWFSQHRQMMLDALPVAGKSGTLEHFFTGAPLAGNVFAKTGTSNHTRTLAGYVRTPGGIRIFALLVNDWMDEGPDASARLRAFQAAFLTAIASG